MEKDQSNERSLDEWLDALHHEDEAIHLNAAVELASRKEPAAIPVLVRALGHDIGAIRHYHAHRALVHLGEPATESLIATLDATGFAAPLAALTLFKINASLHQEKALAALERALNAKNAETRADAAHVLSEIGEAARPLAPALKALLRNEQEAPVARSQAARALLRMNEATPEIAPALLSLLRSDSWRARRAGATALEKIGAEVSDVVSDLIALLRDSQESVDARVEAAQALGAVGGVSPETIPALLSSLRDSDWWVRLYAARALGALSAKGAATALGAALQDTNADVRRSAVWAISRLQKNAAQLVPALVAAIDDPVIGGAAAEALAIVGASALPALQDALRSERAEISGKAAYALSKMTLPKARRILGVWTGKTGREPFTPSCDNFFLRALDITLTPEKEDEFERLLQTTLARGVGSVIDYRSAFPKHEFLYYLVQRRNCVLHGSNRTDIEVMRPIRKSLEAAEGNPLGNINGVYATPDEIWPMFFALVDRIHYDVGLINGPFDGPDTDGQTRKFYQFSINVESLRQRPYADGMIYILPGETFEYAGGAERASRVPVQPLAKLPVSPADFPYLSRMRGFNTRRPGWPDFEGFIFLDEIEKVVVRSLPD
jgi:HEAT repeat protein